MTETYLALYHGDNPNPVTSYAADKAVEMIDFLTANGIEGLYTKPVSEVEARAIENNHTAHPEISTLLLKRAGIEIKTDKQ